MAATMDGNVGQICETVGCEKVAKLRCPTCIKIGIPGSFFCSQECFKGNWATHKIEHKKVREEAPYNPWPGYMFTGTLRPFPSKPMRADVPDHIQRPDYAEHPMGYPASEKALRGNNCIKILDDDEIEAMRVVGKLSREILDVGAEAVAMGVTTEEIDRLIHEATLDRDCYPSPLNYVQFPKSCCTSVNEVICHGIPDQRPLQNGDILNNDRIGAEDIFGRITDYWNLLKKSPVLLYWVIKGLDGHVAIRCLWTEEQVDVTAYHRGFHGDLNETFFVGEVDEEGRNLVKVTWECLDKAIQMVKPGVRYREVGNEIQKHAQAHGLSVVRSYCGHGIHSLFHTAPSVPHYGKNKAVGVMKPGHAFTIEPMICVGTWRDVLWPDNWTAVTQDGKRSAQFEHTLLVTETGCEVLTLRRDCNGLPHFMTQKS